MVWYSLLVMLPLFARYQQIRPIRVQIGAIFRETIDRHLEHAFLLGVENASSTILQGSNVYLSGSVMMVNPRKTAGFSKLVCDMVNGGARAIIGPPDPDLNLLLQSYSSSLAIPYFSILQTPHEPDGGFTFGMFPPSSYLVKVICIVILKWEWNEYFLVYEDPRSLLLYQELLTAYQLAHVRMRIFRIKKGNYIEALNLVRACECKNVIVDVPESKIYDFFVAALQLGLITSGHHYLLTSLDIGDLDLSFVSHNHVRISGLRIVANTSVAKNFTKNVKTAVWDDKKYFPGTHVALVNDAVLAFASGYRNASLLLNNIAIDKPTCVRGAEGGFAKPVHYKHSETLYNYINYAGVSNGMTGNVTFHGRQRSQIKLDILQLNYFGAVEKIGMYDPESTGIRTNNASEAWNIGVDLKMKRLRPHLKVTTIVERPYVMLKRDYAAQVGNDRYEGFCVELLKKLSVDLGFSYTIHVVRDKKYGNRRADGTWDGMIGDILRGDADIAVASLTVNHKRSRVVDFTKPFLPLGISILFKIPGPQAPELFSFLNPLSLDIWWYILISAVILTLIFYIVARISPYEWMESHHGCVSKDCRLGQELHNNYTYNNSVWFVASTLLKGGCEFGPASISTRLLGGIWWLFTLVIVSAYTANLAAVLTVDKRFIPIKSMEDLANQTEIKYGALDGGSTMQFFNESRIDTHTKMWEYMNKHRENFARNNTEGVNRVVRGGYAFLMESTSLEFEVENDCNLTQIGGVLGSKGYGIALQKGSEWTEIFSRKILYYGERGIIELMKTTWWKTRGKNCAQGGAASMKTDRVSLSMENVAGLFLVLLAGLALSVLVALAEFTIKNKMISDTTKESLCSEMGAELCFALQLQNNRPSVNVTKGRCATCKRLGSQHHQLPPDDPGTSGLGRHRSGTTETELDVYGGSGADFYGGALGTNEGSSGDEDYHGTTVTF